MKFCLKRTDGRQWKRSADGWGFKTEEKSDCRLLNQQSAGKREETVSENFQSLHEQPGEPEKQEDEGKRRLKGSLFFCKNRKGRKRWNEERKTHDFTGI